MSFLSNNKINKDNESKNQNQVKILRLQFS